MEKLYGIILSIIVALLAMSLSGLIPIGSVAIAIILGAILGNSIKIPNKFNSGITFSEKTLLALAISLMGINLNFKVLEELGFGTIFLIVVSLILTLVFTNFLAKKQKFDSKFALILGIGNAICGSAAIAATKDIVKLDKDKSALAIAIVNLLGTIGLFVLPLVGLLLGLSDVQIGILLGNTLQSVGHAIAAGFGVNETVGQSATIVKMGRILLLTPVILWLVYTVAKNNITEQETEKKLQVPLFVIGFIFFSILASLDILPKVAVESISWVSEMALIIAMGAIGLKISFKAIKESGWDAFVLAGYVFKFQIIFTLIMITLMN